MENFVQFLRQRTGLSLSKPEILRLYMRYYNEDTKLVNYEQLIRDLREGMKDQQAFSNQSHMAVSPVLEKRRKIESTDASENGNTRQGGPASNKTLTQVLNIISAAIQARLPNMSGKDKQKKAYFLIAENHRPTITFPQLQGACKSRLCCPLTDADLQILFDHMDYEKNGTINLREFMDRVFRQNVDTSVSVSLEWGNSNRHSGVHGGGESAIQRTRAAAELIDRASISYDNKYSDITAPDPGRCRYYSVAELEVFLREKIVERCSLKDTLAMTFIRLFGDGGQHNGGNRVITRDQVKFTFWKKLRLNVSEKDVNRFFEVHEHKPGSGYIIAFELMDAIIKKHAKNEPLLDDNHNAFTHNEKQKVAIAFQHNQGVSTFFRALRLCINRLINRQSRAPHFLVHSTNRMTVHQSKEFFRTRLGFDVDAQFSQAVIEEVLLRRYNTNSGATSARDAGLVDMKRILMEAMSLSDEGEMESSSSSTLQQIHSDDTSTFHKSLLNGSLVTVDRMPAALTRKRMSPQDVEQMLREKCNERLKNEHPHANLHKMFQKGIPPQRDTMQQEHQLSANTTGGNERLIDSNGMQRVLRTWDIIMDPADFEAFFSKHDRGDGMIDIHKFLRRLLPPADLNDNPFVPKDPKDARTEMQLSNVLRHLTGKQRDVSYLNGISTNRVTDNFMESVFGHPTAAALYAASAREAAAKAAARPNTTSTCGGRRSSRVSTGRTKSTESRQSLASGHSKLSRNGMNSKESINMTGFNAAAANALFDTSHRVALDDLALNAESSLQRGTEAVPTSNSVTTHLRLSDDRTNADEVIRELTSRLSTPASTKPQQRQEQIQLDRHLAENNEETGGKKKSQLLRELARIYELKEKREDRTSYCNGKEKEQFSSPGSHFALNDFIEKQKNRQKEVQKASGATASKTIIERQAEVKTKVQPKRPTSAPNSAARISPRKQYGSTTKSPTGAYMSTAYSTNALATGRSSLSGPRTAAYLPRYGSITSEQPTSPRSARSAPITNADMMDSPRGSKAHPKFVYTGQRRKPNVDPIGLLLQRRYKIANGHTTTSHEHYGLFVQHLTKSINDRAKLIAKQERSEAIARANISKNFEEKNDDEDERLKSAPAAGVTSGQLLYNYSQRPTVGSA